MATIGKKKLSPPLKSKSNSYVILIIIALCIFGSIVAFGITRFNLVDQEISRIRYNVYALEKENKELKTRLNELQSYFHRQVRQIEELKQSVIELENERKSKDHDDPNIYMTEGLDMDNRTENMKKEEVKRNDEECKEEIENAIILLKKFQLNMEESLTHENEVRKKMKDLTEFVKISDLKILESYYDEKLLNVNSELYRHRDFIKEMENSQKQQEKAGEILGFKLEGLQDYTYKAIKKLESKVKEKEDALEAYKRNIERRFQQRKQENPHLFRNDYFRFY